MKKTTYKLIDISIMSAIACITEAVSLLLLKYVFKTELFTLSVVVTLSIILTMRWKYWGFVPAVLGGIIYCAINGGEPLQYLVYGLGNAAVMLNLVWFACLKPSKISSNLWLSLLFALSGFLAVIIGRGLLSLFIDLNIRNFLNFLLSDALNIIIGLLIVFIARKQNGMFEYQEDYLKRVAEEEEKQYG